MTARRFPARRWALPCVLAGLIPVLAGCRALDAHAVQKIPHLGAYDPDQPRELQMVSHPPYIVEPPDELEVTIHPSSLEFMPATLTVQTDGMIDLGFFGDVYVSGLTLNQIEQKVVQQVAAFATERKIVVQGPIHASVKLVNGTQSKRFYVLGTVTNQASFPCTGNDTVIDAILTAGLRSNSIPEKAYLARPRPDGTCLILRIDWEQIRQGNTFTNYQLFPGDRIVVPGGRAPSLLGTLLGGG